MRKLFFIGLILGLFTSYSYAQMMDQKGTMDQKEMMDSVTGTMNQMSGMMGKMPKMMTKLTPAPDIRKM